MFLVAYVVVGKMVRSEETCEVEFQSSFRSLMLLLFCFVVIADLVVVRSEEGGVVIFHPLLPPPRSQSWKTSHTTKAVAMETKFPGKHGMKRHACNKYILLRV